MCEGELCVCCCRCVMIEKCARCVIVLGAVERAVTVTSCAGIKLVTAGRRLHIKYETINVSTSSFHLFLLALVRNAHSICSQQLDQWSSAIVTLFPLLHTTLTILVSITTSYSVGYCRLSTTGTSPLAWWARLLKEGCGH